MRIQVIFVALAMTTAASAQEQTDWSSTWDQPVAWDQTTDQEDTSGWSALDRLQVSDEDTDRRREWREKYETYGSDRGSSGGGSGGSGGTH